MSGQHPGGPGAMSTLIVEFVLFSMRVVYVNAPPPSGFTTLVTVARTVGGLKKVIKLEVRDALETVTPDEDRERPGARKGPRLVTGSGPAVLSKQMSFVQVDPVNENTVWLVCQV